MRGTLDPLVLALAAAATALAVPAQPQVPAALSRGFDPVPTRRALLAEGCGTGLHFEVSLDGEEAKALFDQGMMQLHGLAHFEAERSFREVAALEPNCAMAYWGVALANVANPDRAAHFIEEAVRRRSLATPRERRFVDALARFYEVSMSTPFARSQPAKDKAEEIYELPQRSFAQSLADRSNRLLAAWEAILEKDDDIEVAALVIRQIWLNAVYRVLAGSELEQQAARGRQLLARIFKKSPRHPANFYRLHLDVFGDLLGALQSVGVAGHHAPAISGQWSASGRLLASLHRHEDALEYFEAALRASHACLQRERAMPFVLQGYGEDAAAYARCLMYLGRVKEARAWVKYLLDLPRHPRLNRLDDPGSIAGQARRCLEEGRLLTQADALLRAGEAKAAVEVLRKEDAARPNRVGTMARLLDALVRAGDKGRAAACLLRLRKVAGLADLDQPSLGPASALARELHLPMDWRQPRNRAADWPRDLGPLPYLSALGPTHWTPPTPLGWSLRDGDGNKVSLADYRGKPVVVVLHLGFG